MKITKLFGAFAMMMFMATSCGGNASKESANDSVAEENEAVENDAFYATQPVHSGTYIANNYDITGEGNKARKGRYDGRIIFTLTPKSTSAFYVYENGNRTKISYKVILKKPFEKGDSGIYRTVDANDLPVTINTDSTEYYLTFQKKDEKIKIGFDSKPKTSTNAFEALEDMNKALQKDK
ncbi:MAG: hypothetical protein HDR88_16320 [Bacteroides sp.]|nr:hypothetical protein [Bacteroides sp.]